MVLGYGIAAMCMFSLLSHMTNESYLERDSKGISAPAKKALHAHPKYVIIIGLSSLAAGGAATLCWKKK